MHELELNSQLLKVDLFTLFKQQVARDFEGCGLPSEFAAELPPDFERIKEILIQITEPHFNQTPGLLMQLLYRIDISEAQLKKYGAEHVNMSFPAVVAELIIKRELQKVIIKKSFSKK